MFVDKRLLINISGFSLFLCKNCTPSPEISHPYLPQQPPSKNCDRAKPPSFFENLVGDSTPHHKCRGILWFPSDTQF